MKTSIGFRISAAICAAILLVATFSFISIPTQADSKEETAAKKAAKAVEEAELARKECEDLNADAKRLEDAATAAENAQTEAEKAAADAMPKVDAKKTSQDDVADKAAAAADAAAKAADDALDNEEKGSKEKEAKAGDAEKASGKADKDAADADKKIGDAEVQDKKQDAREKRKAARDARRKARAARRKAIKKCDEAKAKAEAAAAAIKLAEELLKKKTDRGAKDDGGIGDKLKDLKDRQKTLDKPPKQGTIIPPSDGETVQTKTANGLNTVTFNTPQGRIKVNLPDDMMAGDTISGTVIAEPNGKTKEERDENLGELTGYVIALNPVVPAKQGSTISDTTFVVSTNLIVPTPINISVSSIPNFGIYLMPNENSSVVRNPKGGLTCINESCSPISQLVFTRPTPEPITITNNETPPTTFTVPNLGQTGKPIEITGSFDGNSSNTGINIQPVPPANPNAPSQPPGAPYYVMAESKSKAIIMITNNVIGPLEVTVNEGDKKTTAPLRNVKVDLTAPTTSLLKGQEITMNVEVNGLQGITQPVPLTLTCTGVITMEGGVYQPLVIQPSDVGAGGSYTTTRRITGVETGGWTATATVVTHRFNVCLQDDTAPRRRILWNTVTGDYAFVNPFAAPKPTGQQPQTGGTTPPPLTGTGKMVMKGCIITLQHNAPDRRVFSRLDACTNTGNATVETDSPKSNVTITDRNIADNTCPSQ